MFAAFLAVWPLNAVLLRITVRTFPPDIELTGEFRGILYDDPGAVTTAAQVRRIRRGRQAHTEAKCGPGLNDCQPCWQPSAITGEPHASSRMEP
jgi:hypothetical protein